MLLNKETRPIQLQYSVHFGTNTLEKDMSLLISTYMGERVSLMLFYKDSFGIK